MPQGSSQIIFSSILSRSVKDIPNSLALDSYRLEIRLVLDRWLYMEVELHWYFWKLGQHTCAIVRMFAIVPRMPWTSAIGTRSFVVLMAAIVTPSSWVTSLVSSWDCLVSEEGLACGSFHYVRSDIRNIDVCLLAFSCLDLPAFGFLDNLNIACVCMMDVGFNCQTSASGSTYLRVRNCTAQMCNLVTVVPAGSVYHIDMAVRSRKEPKVTEQFESERMRLMSLA